MDIDTKAACERLGQRLRKLREDAGLSQRGLAEKVKLEQAFISRLETGQSEPCLGTLCELADAFDLTVSQFLKGV